MALNIPMPGLPLSGLNQAISTGGNLFQQMMHPVIQRENMAREWRQHLDSLALQKEAAGRAAALAPLQRRAAELAIQKAEMEADPAKKMAYIQAIMKGIHGMGGQQNASTQSNLQTNEYPALNKMFSGQGMFNEGELTPGNINLGNRPQVQNPETGGTSTVYSMSIGTPQGEVLIPRVSDDGRLLSEKEAIAQFHKTGKHLGIYSSPEEATKAAQLIHEQQAQSIAQPSSSQGGLNFTPEQQMALGMAGIKLPTIKQTPEDKQAMAVDLFKQKQAIKNGTADGGNIPLTTPARTKLQIQKTAIPQLRQIIKELKEAPSPVEPSIGFGLGNLYRPGARSKHHELLNIGKDLFVKAKGINATDKTLETGEKVLGRGTFESDASYRKRLDDLDKTLDHDEQYANEALSQGLNVNSNGGSDNNKTSNMTRVFYNGKSHMVPNDKVEEALKAGGSLHG